MKIEVNENGEIVLKEIFSNVLLETSEGNAIGVCMRDDTIEIVVKPKDKLGYWYRVNMQMGVIDPIEVSVPNVWVEDCENVETITYTNP